MAQITVTTLSDEAFDGANDDTDGTGLSLREAIGLAGAGDDIVFDAALAGGTLTLTQGELLSNSDLSIDGDTDGDDAADITISGNDTQRIIAHSEGTLDLRSLTLTNGYYTGRGGAIYVSAGDLNIAHTTVQNSMVTSGGGGIYFDGDEMTIVSSTFTGNSSGSFGGAIVAGGTNTVVVNTTIDGNTTTFDGAAIVTDSTTVSIVNSTITNNDATNGGTGSYAVGNLLSPSAITILNSVVAGNTTSNNPANTADAGAYGATATLTAQNSFFGTTVTIDTDNGGNINNGGDPLLNALADNGGTVATRTAQVGSQVVDAGNNTLLPTDTLDVDGDSDTAEALPLDADGGARVQNTTVNMGASETVELIVTTLDDELDNASLTATVADMGGAADLSLREAVFLANFSTGGLITFDSSLIGGTTAGVDDGVITVDGALYSGYGIGLYSAGSVHINGDVNGDGTSDITISGDTNGNGVGDAGDSRLFYNAAGASAADLTLQNLILTHGFGSGGGAVIAYSQGITSILDSVLRNSTSTGNGGGVFSFNGNVVIERSEVLNNSAATLGGGVFINGIGGTLSIVDSTFSGNYAGEAGGGLATVSVSSNVTNVTFEGNSTEAVGGAGGVLLYDGTHNFTNVTVTGNSTTGDVGGIAIVGTTGVLNLVNSLVLGNSDTDGASEVTNTTAGFGGGFTDGTLNVTNSITDTATAAVADVFAAVNGTTGGGQLGNNGGPVQTVALNANAANLALDAGDDAAAPTQDATGANRFDQAGVANNGVNTSDLGAVELVSQVPVPLTLEVTTLNDELDNSNANATLADMGGASDLSLREAMFLASHSSTGGNITFDPSLIGGVTPGVDDGVITLDRRTYLNDPISLVGSGGGAVHVNGDVNGDGVRDITISGDRDGNGIGDNFDTQLFRNESASATGHLTLQHLTLTSGSSSSGGGAVANRSSGADLIILDSVISNSETGDGGGAVFHDSTGTLRIERSEFLNNSAFDYGGAVLSNIATATVEISDSTFSGNYASFAGGALTFFSSSTLENVTITGNSDGFAGGGGVLLYGARTHNFTNVTVTGNSSSGDAGGIAVTGNAVLNLTNSLVLGNSDVAGSPEINATNWSGFGGSSPGTLNVVNSITDTTTAAVADVFAAVDGTTGGGQLGDNGGPVQTVALNANAANLALDAGDDASAPAQDATGTNRFDQAGVANNGANVSDLGAVELASPIPTPLTLEVTTLDDELDNSNANATLADMGGAADLSLREAVHLVNNNALGGTITFASALTGGTTAGVDDGVLTLTLGELALVQDQIIDGDVDGDNAADITIDGNDASRIFNISGAGIEADLLSLSLTNGYTTGSGGAVIARSGATLNVLDSTLSNNQAFNTGGAIQVQNGILNVVSSTINGNSANNGGAVRASYSTTSFVNTTVTDNSAIQGTGGIYALNGTTQIGSSTITGNVSTLASSSNSGGVFVSAYYANPVIEIDNSILSGNTAGGVADDFGSETYSGVDVVTATANSSLLGTAAAGQFTGSNNIATDTPLLNALADNGGTVQTMSAQDISQAVNNGDNALLPADTFDVDGDADTTEALPLDADGNPRIQDTTVNIGASETVFTPPIVVTTLADEAFDGANDATDGTGLSLREAIGLANAGETIVFDPSLVGGTTAGVDDGVLTLTMGELALTQSQIIDGDVDGDNSADITISGNDASRIFNIDGATTEVDLLSLTLTNGYTTGAGGAIFAGIGATLNVLDSTISDSEAAFSGGALQVQYATVNVVSSTIEGNTAGEGGGVSAVGSTTSFVNTTITDNSATNFSAYAAGGINLLNGSAQISSSTITGNTSTQAGSGGGVFAYANNGNSVVDIQNSILSGNTGGGVAADFGSSQYAGTVTANADSSLLGTAAAGQFTGSNNISIDTPLLNALADNGGTVQTMSAQGASQAVNNGDNTLLPADTFDVDGDADTAETLPLDADGNARFQDTTVNIGASETVFTPPIVVTTLADEAFDGANDATDGTGLSLREAIGLASAGDTIAFDASLTGGTTFGVDNGMVRLSLGELSLVQSVTIDGDVDGDNAADITIDGGGGVRLFNISGAGTEVDLNSLTLTSGYSVNSGGAVYSGANTMLTIQDSTIQYSVALAGGGVFAGGVLNVVNSTITNNYALNNGGGIYTQGGDASIVNTTITGNEGVAQGGGLFSANTGQTVTISSSTITDNTSNGQDAGISLYAYTGVANLILTNSVLSGNTVYGVSDDFGTSSYSGTANVTANFSLLGTAVGAQLSGGSNNVSTDTPLLAGLADNGGTVQTRAALSGSQLIDAGDASLLPADTQDVDGDTDTAETLPIDANGAARVQGTLDIGATETVPFSPINGDAGNNFLLGTPGIDTINGLAGQDTIRGLERADVLDGGDGDADWVDYTGSDAAVSVNLDTDAVSGGHAQGDTIQNFERVIGSAFADTLTGDAGKNVIRGGDGADTLDGGGGADVLDYADATASITVSLASGSGTAGFANGDVLSNFEAVFGSTFSDDITGNAGRNILRGNAGADTLNGGDGRDFADYRNATSAVNVDLGAGTGTAGDANGDSLVAIEGIFGSRFDDTLSGGANRSILEGMGGEDTFVFNAALGGGLTLLPDFNAADDTIALDDAVFTALTAGALASTAFEINSTGRASTGDVRIIYNTTNGDLRYDADGANGTNAVRIATLETGLLLTEADFLVI